MYSWTFQDLEIRNDANDDPKVVNVEIVLGCIHPGEAPSGMSGPPEFYDPGSPPEWEIDTIEIVFDSAKVLSLDEEQFSQLFPNGDDMMQNAIEDAMNNGDTHEEA